MAEPTKEQIEKYLREKFAPQKSKLPEPFKDQRGYIQNIVELRAKDEPIRGAAIIFSHARTTRSNHYHKTDSHWLYVLSGEMHYWERAVGEKAYPQHPIIYKTGDICFTGPLREHKTYFPVETVLVSLSRLARDAESHEDDVVRVKP